MRSAILATILLALLPVALSQTALPTATQTSSPAEFTSASGPIPTTTTPSANVNAILSFLLPSLPPISLSPSQSSAILADASQYLSSYTAASPLASLQGDLIADLIFASTTPSNEQIGSLSTLLQGVSTGLVNDPSAYISKIDGVVAPFAFASRVTAYEEGFREGLATVVASELGVSAPASKPTSAQSAFGNAAPRGTGVAVAAVGLAAGVVGVAMF
ncbi:MAG: hypothetical protein MMC23_002540 [Stictis urceolatum]|nr:hypothetical protein [Stictis urceolata]